MRSLKISVSLLLVDVLTAFLVRGYIYPIETFGDMLMVETALGFLLAGFVDFATSVAFVQFRRSVFASKERFSAEKRKHAERRAIALVASGVILLSILIMLAVFKV
jgi:hypothetical protein